jgi:hypothetical protein
MNQNAPDFLPLRVTHTSPDGKRSYDRRDKQRLIVSAKSGTPYRESFATQRRARPHRGGLA